MIPSYAMSFDHFARQALVVRVELVAAENGMYRLVPSDEVSESSLLEFHREFVRLGQASGVRDQDINAWASDRIKELFDMSLSEDVWYSRLPEGRSILLVKDGVAAKHGVQAIVRRAHFNEVLEAARNGLGLTQAVSEEYGQDLARAFAQRNLPVS